MGLKAYGRGLNGPDTPRAAFHDIAEGCDAVAVLAEHFSNFAAGKLHIAMVRPWNTGPAHSPPATARCTFTEYLSHFGMSNVRKLGYNGSAGRFPPPR
jgi:hypothetical protein